jgi:hypothetical protein
MRRPTDALPLPLLVLLAALASCDDPAPRGYAPTVGPGAGPAKTEGPGPSSSTAAPAKKMPQMPPLTEASAKAVLAAQVATLGSDDESRQALLYLADLGDRSCLAAVRERLLARDANGFADSTAAAVGAEALLAFGEPDGAATALAVAKQYAAEDSDPDESLLRALARVKGAERAEALKTLLDVAGSDDAAVAALAVQLLAASGDREAGELFARLARDAAQDAPLRGAAAAGLLHMKDPKAAEIADALVRSATSKDADAKIDDAELLLGFGVEGAVEASPYVRKLVDAVLDVNDAGATFTMDELAPALAAIHRQGGGAELVPWLREVGKKYDNEYADVAALSLWTLGDDSQAAAVANQLRDALAKLPGLTDLDGAVAILDAAARRGVAGTPPFRPIVDTAAQIQAPSSAVAANGHVRALNLAAAHAFLKSSK